MALGFGRIIAPAPQELTFSPSLRFENLFAVVDLYRTREVGNRRRRVIEASWTCSVTREGIKMSNGSEKMSLKGLNPYSVSFLENEGSEAALQEWDNNVHHLHFAWDDALGHLECTPELQARVTLFRRDNMKSVCLVDQFINYDVNNFVRLWPTTRKVSTFFWVGENLHFASDDAGRTAQHLMFNRGFARTIRVEGNFRLEWVPPPDEEMAWFTNMNEVLAEGHEYEPNRDDLDALSSIPHFEFEVNYISFFFAVSRKKREDFSERLSPNDVMVALEGLYWQ